MAKERKNIPPKTREIVLKEYRYRCAKCGVEGPQLHHIDEDPSNNEPMNLIPLCPNCHLRDQHDPTASIEIEKLQLFRKYKDPNILTPQFHPIYNRLTYLNEINDNSDFKSMKEKSLELIEFIKSFKKGDFYSKQISKLIKEPSRVYTRSLNGGPDHEFSMQVERNRKKYVEQLLSVNDTVKGLLIELLRYQEWKND